MKKLFYTTLLLGPVLLLAPGCSHNKKPEAAASSAVTSSPQGPPPPQPAPPNTYQQKPMGPPPALVSQDQAQAIINRFKDAYPKLGSPRLLIYVNRELVDEHSGMQLTHRSEHVETTQTTGGTNGNSTTVTSSADNNYRPEDKPRPTLADKQTVRDVERIFGRPLRAAGASLADEQVAAELIADKPLTEFVGTTDSPQAQKDREALGKITDAVIEVLVSSKSVTVPTFSSSQSINIPDIQATVIKLSDSKILGQVSSSEVVNRVPLSSLANYDVQEITEATALALMDDMSSQAK
jgi:hypothetical protein